MEYFLVLVFQLLGISFHVMQKIISIGAAHPEKNRSQVFSAFMYEDWDTLLVSALVMLTHLVTHFTVNYYNPSVAESVIPIPFINVNVPYVIASFIIAFVLGYAGQRLIYKYLGSAEKYLEKKSGQ